MTKKDKRTLKHAALMSRVHEDAHISKQKRRRRPGRKLEAADSMVGGMREALANVPGIDEEDSDEWEGLGSADGGDGNINMEENSGMTGRRVRVRRRAVPGKGKKMVMKSLKHKPGAMKRKAVMEEKERARFGRNLAQLASGGSDRGGEQDTQAGAGDAASDGGQHEKWAALRRFIGTTIEKEAAFRHG